MPMMALMIPAPGMNRLTSHWIACSMILVLMKSFTASMKASCMSLAISFSCSQAAIGPWVISVLTSSKPFSSPTTTGSPKAVTMCRRMFW